MNEDLSQPFWVGHNNPRFCGARYGYLPPLVQPEEEVLLSRIPPNHRLYNELQQLKARFIYLEGKIHSLTDKKTNKDTTKYTIE